MDSRQIIVNIKIINNKIKTDPNNLNLWGSKYENLLLLFNILYEEKILSMALGTLEKIIMLNSSNIDLLLEKAKLLSTMGRYEEAKSSLTVFRTMYN